MSRKPSAEAITWPDLAALVFDFDRTLVPLGNFVRWRVAAGEMRARYLAAGIREEVLAGAPRGCFGLYRHVALSRALAPADLARVQEEASATLARFEEEAIERAELYAGAESLLYDLPRLGLRAAIVSSNPAHVIRAILARLGVAGCFAAIVGRDGLADLKPAPDGMLRACAELGLTADRCLAIGDNAGDVAAALAAGMPAVGVASGVSSRDELLAAGARVVFGDVQELGDRLRAERA